MPLKKKSTRDSYSYRYGEEWLKRFEMSKPLWETEAVFLFCEILYGFFIGQQCDRICVYDDCRSARTIS